MLSCHIYLFLGAVRDMISDGNTLLESVCDKSKIPLLGIRFGKVPKLTSKILSLLVFHHSNRTLGISLKRLLSGKNKTMNIPSTSISTSVQSNKATIDTGQMNRVKQQPTCVNIIFTVHKSSTEITVDIEKRDQLYWRLVRVIVCSLWRSKLVSTSSSSSSS